MNTLINILAKNKFTKKFSDKKILVQLIKYIVVGVSTIFIEMLLFFILSTPYFVLFYKLEGIILYLGPFLKEYFSIDVKLNLAYYVIIFSNSIALTINFWVNFIMNRKWSFESKEPLLKQISIYACLFIFNIWISNTIITFLNLHLKIHKMIAKIISIGVIVSWNFIIYKKIIFKEKQLSV